MKIISPFNDYYDSVQKYETEKTQVVYQRTPLEFDLRYLDKTKKSDLIVKINNTFKELVERHSMFLFRERYSINIWKFIYNNKEYDFISNRLLVIFCGRIYKCIEIIKTNKKTKLFETIYFYDFDEFNSYLDENEIRYKEIRYKNNVKKYFDFSLLSKYKEFCIENKITIAVLTEEKLFINCPLNKFQFYKVFDTYTAYQELDMWLSGTLSYPQNIMVEVSNETKIEKAGFDKKISFRKRSTK